MSSKYILYHYPLSPSCRQIRVLLNEFGVPFQLQEVKFWKKSEGLIRMNPTGEVPILFEIETKNRFVDSFVISEYLISIYNNKVDLLISDLLSKDEVVKAEIRRIEMLFSKNFYYQVSKPILEEKVYNTFLNERPLLNMKKYKNALKNLEVYLGYIEYLLSNKDYLARNTFSLADITAASHISSLDYLGEINWNKFQKMKNWYIIIKSKPSFRDILNDKIEGFKPSSHYTDLDFR